MDSAGLISQFQECLKKVEALRSERMAIGSPKVKAWKTEVEHLLRLGGKNTSKLLQNFQALKFGASAMGAEAVNSSEVKFASYQAEMDAAEKILKNAVQTIQIFGVAEEQKLPDWFKPDVKAAGTIKLGSREVDIKTVTVAEFLSAVQTFAESDKSLDESLKKEVNTHLDALKKHSLLTPFMNLTLDRIFSKL
ncbi:MAG: hypothetical protein C5B54_03470 [Acidobacteria bacterium]|nr:MAG: hypothetical protein C5B54_03470 [Acidobacteriota bacterium]